MKLDQGNKEKVKLLLNQITFLLDDARRYHQSKKINFDEKYNTIQILKMTKTLSLAEITIFFEATGEREKGLAFLRTDNINDGSRFLRNARDIARKGRLSTEALLLFESYHLAAEAYLHYKEGHYDTAIYCLSNAISNCQKLGNDFKYAVEGRKIHLLINLIRVTSISGKKREAIKMICKLILYLDEQIEYLPLGNANKYATLEVISYEEKLFLFNQLLKEFSFLISKKSLGSNKISRYVHKLLISSQYFETGGIPVVHYWISAFFASANGHIIDFLENTKCFYSSKTDFLGTASDLLRQELQLNKEAHVTY